MRYQKQKTELNSYLAKVIFILLEIWISTVFENYFEYPKFEYPKSISNEVTLPKDVADKSRKAVEHMLNVSK